MDLRINEVHPTTPSNPFLSPAAANRAWLAPALRARGVEITADDRTATLTHLHGDATSPASRRGRVIRTSHSFDRQGAEVTAVLSHKQAGLLGGQISAVIAPALATDELPMFAERGDHLCFVFDGRDEYALAAALAIGASSERPLVALIDRSTPLSERCSEVLAEAERARRIQLERVKDDLLPAVLAGAGAYLAVGRSAFDMGALTALGCGVPIVSLAGSPAAELFVHGESGFACRSVEEACRAIERLDLLRPVLGRDRARRLFDAAAAAGQYEALYERVARGERPVFVHPEFGRTARLGASDQAVREGVSPR